MPEFKVISNVQTQSNDYMLHVVEQRKVTVLGTETTTTSGGQGYTIFTPDKLEAEVGATVELTPKELAFFNPVVRSDD